MNTNKQKLRRKIRTRSKVQGTKEMPRLSVHRSNKFMYAQLIDDAQKITIIGVSEKHLDSKEEKKATKTEKAKKLGILLAKKAGEKKVQKAVFDKGSFRYHGRVKAFAEGAREGGLVF